MRKLESLAVVIARVAEMEARFDRVCAAGRNDPTVAEDAKILAEYMDSGLWLADYTRDELGLLPKTLKRGVLSQDGLYNLLTDF
jgi:hypothetical protein